jgi:predicted membrane GTPase involved in stress response
MGKIWTELPEKSQLKKLSQTTGNLQALFEEIVRTIPAPRSNTQAAFKMQVSTLDFIHIKAFMPLVK